MVFNDKIFLGSTKDGSFFSNDSFYNDKKKRKTAQETKQKMKNEKRTWTDISPKKIYERPTVTWKDAQHH